MEGTPGAVPGFLAKLWALVEDPASDHVIGWSRNGQSFCILDEQRFAKELLPKYFKHNNISSFIRQLNMYGFRKVIALESGMIIQEKSSAIEFQHPFFKQGEASLLENIKRKVSTVRAEDLKVCPEALQKVLSEVQGMREQQSSMDAKLANMKRENKALWKEVASLRQKHSQQQQLLSKILQFILSLMRGNYIVGVKRNRSLPDAAGSPAAKYSRQYIRIPVEGGEAVEMLERGTPNGGDRSGVIIREVTNTVDGVPHGPPSPAQPSGSNGNDPAAPVQADAPVGLDLGSPGLPLCEIPEDSFKAGGSGSEVPELHSTQTSDSEDPASVIDSILSENSSSAANEALLDRDEMQDFLNCIEANLEELQSMLSGKKLNYGSEGVSEALSPECPVLRRNETETSPRMTEGLASIKNVEEGGMSELGAAENKDMQLVQYIGNPLLSLFEELPTSESGEDPQDTKDFLFPEPEGKRALPSAGGDPDPLSFGTLAPQEECVSPLGPYELPPLSDDSSGEYKLFPLLLLSPVANFIEEASEIEHTT
ncbi:heat shock factor protein 3-like isoform X2 [Tachyglossus aculeatus]|uniref:heat shock factor protein 3-like isoform X2 n=1 Tax=Tachyglossus aculeatus TaxID=9261 RepID=UPI0018F7109D|nr:heat shock factor protein 3-like isoform X2 [Tachyglossus aculeatus]